jgi:hypothetical protein
MLKIINVSTNISSVTFRVNMVGRSFKLYIGQAVGGELDKMVLIGGAEEHHLLPALYKVSKNDQPYSP